MILGVSWSGRDIRWIPSESTHIGAKYGAFPVRIFGSVACHTADEKSNSGFLVGLAPKRAFFYTGGFAVVPENCYERVDFLLRGSETWFSYEGDIMPG